MRLGVLLFLIAPLWAVPNVITLRNRSGAVQEDYPLQFGRPFGPGEIRNFPQVGTCTDRGCQSVSWLPTQADVKTRWPSSVRFAVISVLIPRLPAGPSPVYLTFRNQPDCNCGQSLRLTRGQMLASQYGFDAQVIADFGSEAVMRSARDMLAAGNYSFWQEGPVATTVILGDHSAARAWDFGSDAHRSLRPIFHVTFWPGIRKVKVRVIVEASNSEAAQDQSYAVTVTSRGAPVWRHERFTHTALTSWSRVFWIGPAPTDAIDIDYSLAYLTSVRALPNFDSRRIIPKSVLDRCSATWRDAPKDLYDAGPAGWPPNGWQKAMGTAGGRPDIGPYPKWHVLWVYTGDYRMRQFALGLSELAAAWPARIREANPAKYLDRAQTVPGLGYPVSISARPTTNFTTGYGFRETTEEDRIKVVGPLTNAGWRIDVAHQPDPWSISYLLTGDPYYLEQGQFWAFYSAHRPNGAATRDGALGRGPTGAEGGLDYLQIRAQAWMLRGRAEIAALTPDGSPIKHVLNQWIDDAIAQREGAWNIEGTGFYRNPNWNWGRQFIAAKESLGGVLPPNGAFKKGDRSLVQGNYGLDPSVTGSAFSLFETDYYLYAIGRSVELGYPAGSLLRYLGRLYIHIATSSSFNPYLLQSGRYPTVGSSGAYYTDDTALLGAWWATRTAARAAKRGEGGPPVWRDVNAFPLDDPDNGYEFLAAAAISFLTDETGGSEAWKFVNRHIAINRVQDNNPKWAIVPRNLEKLR